MRKIALVTGSAGFVGRHLTPKIEAAGYTVFGVDNKNGNPLKTVLSVSQGVKFNLVVHLAANIESIDKRIQGTHEVYQDINLDYMMVDYLAKNPPDAVVWPTSCAVDNPGDPYAWVKLTSERLFHTLEGKVPVYMLRPYSGYGGDQALSYPFPAILDRALRLQNPLQVWGSGEQVRDFIHIDDLTDAFMMAVDGKFPAFKPVSIGTGVGTRIIDVATKIAAAVGYKPEIQTLGSKPASGLYRVADTTMARELGFEAKITLEEGIKRAINEAYERKNPA
jgi:nucleoside-diphosphate-sugar epimerase